MSIVLTQLRTELGNYFRTNSKEVVAMIYRAANIAQYFRKISKVKGRYPAIHSVTSHVVQGWAASWNAIGDVTIKVNELISYHQKVNFKITPSEIESSWLAELYDKNKKPAEMPISQYIFEKELKPKVVSDIEYLMVKGIYDANDLATFGKAMNGLEVVLNEGLTNSDNPMYGVLLSAAPTASNIVDIVTEFEKKTPKTHRRFIKKIFMSSSHRDNYVLKYEDLYGANTLFGEDKKLKTRLNRWEIVGLDDLEGSNLIFCTPDENMLMLVDQFDNPPMVTDVQVADYDVKIFMEWWLGVGFYTNQMVFVSKYSGGSGLGSDNETYFG